MRLLTTLSLALVQVFLTRSAVVLEADGVSDTYTLINTTFGELEVPDCKHTEFGPHVTQQLDSDLGRYVFAVHSHIRQDDDRCQVFDRQRTEIRTDPKAENGFQLVGFNGDRLTISWNFKLDEGFLPPYSFCHIHQLKFVGGDDSMPVITLTPRRTAPENELQLLQYDSNGELHFLATTPLAPFLGEWIHAYSDVTVGSTGSYVFELTRLSDGEPLFSYASNNIDFWRNGTTFMRAKWGLYRSIQEAVLSRNETVLFDRFCMGKGNIDRCN